MTTKEAKEKWGIDQKWIEARCREKMIPYAEKVKGRWVIPENSDVPPCTRHRAVGALLDLIEVENGNDVDLFPKSRAEENEKIYIFLSANQFITRLDGKIKKSIYKARVLNKGMGLIKDETEKNTGIAKRTRVLLGIDAKVFKAEMEHEIKRN